MERAELFCDVVDVGNSSLENRFIFPVGTIADASGTGAKSSAVFGQRDLHKQFNAYRSRA